MIGWLESHLIKSVNIVTRLWYKCPSSWGAPDQLCWCLLSDKVSAMWRGSKTMTPPDWPDITFLSQTQLAARNNWTAQEQDRDHSSLERGVTQWLDTDCQIIRADYIQILCFIVFSQHQDICWSVYNNICDLCHRMNVYRVCSQTSKVNLQGIFTFIQLQYFG